MALSNFLGRLLKAQEICTYKSLNTPVFVSPREHLPIFQRQTAKNKSPFPVKMIMRKRPPCTFEGDGGSGVYPQDDDCPKKLKVNN